MVKQSFILWAKGVRFMSTGIIAQRRYHFRLALYLFIDKSYRLIMPFPVVYLLLDFYRLADGIKVQKSMEIQESRGLMGCTVNP